MTSVREWLHLVDPADADHEVRADVTWLLSSWGCIFARGCHGVVAGRPDDGCCSHGAFFSDREDEQRVRAAAAELTTADWERHGARSIVQYDDLGGERRRKTRVVGGACVFLNRPGSPQGPGCALHALALRTGRHPLETKPDVCWQLPIARESEWQERTDGRRVLVTTLTEFDRSRWGSGGADLHWWCTESREAHGAAEPLYRSYAPELTALIGAPAYDELARLCDARRVTRGLLAVHPASRGQASNL